MRRAAHRAPYSSFSRASLSGPLDARATTVDPHRGQGSKGPRTSPPAGAAAARAGRGPAPPGARGGEVRCYGYRRVCRRGGGVN